MHRGSCSSQSQGQGVRALNCEDDGRADRRSDQDASQGTQHPLLQDRRADGHRRDHWPGCQSCI